MAKKILNFCCSVILVSVLSACNSVHVDGVDTGESLPEQSIEEVLTKPEQISFETVKAYVLGPACLRCHSNGRLEGSVDLSTHEAVVAGGANSRPSVVPFSTERSLLHRTLNATGRQRMPPLGQMPQLSEQQKFMVALWIQGGALKVADPDSASPVNPEPAPVPLTLREELEPYFLNPETIDYNAVNAYVFSESCNECHSENGSKPDDDAITFGVDLTSYNSLVNNPFVDALQIGEPTESSLFVSVANQEMPAARDGYDPVNAYKVKLLRLWILNCAIETVPAPESDQLLENPRDPEKVRDCSPPATEPDSAGQPVD